MRSSELDASLQYLRPEEGILWDRGRKEGWGIGDWVRREREKKKIFESTCVVFSKKVQRQNEIIGDGCIVAIFGIDRWELQRETEKGKRFISTCFAKKCVLQKSVFGKKVCLAKKCDAMIVDRCNIGDWGGRKERKSDDEMKLLGLLEHKRSKKLRIRFDAKLLQGNLCLVSWWTTISSTLTSSTCLTSPVTTLFQHKWSPMLWSTNDASRHPVTNFSTSWIKNP